MVEAYRFQITVMIIATRQTHWAIVLAATAILLLTPVAAITNPVNQPRPSLIVTPLTGIAVSGPKGGPFSPSSFQYRVSASTGTVRYSVSAPSWLTVSSSVGVTDVSGITITLTVSSTASQLAPGKYGPSVAFTNVTNGHGSASKSATLIIQAPSDPPAPATRIIRAPLAEPPASKGLLLDGRGGYLMDDRNGRLLRQ